MTSDIFLVWLKALDRDMEMEGRKIALLMDNAPGHGKDDTVNPHLNNIQLIRLPKNTTSVSQPLDAGIIMSFKVKYSRLMLPTMSYYYHEKKSGAKPKIPKAALWACLPTAWNDVSVSTIRNCFARVPVIPKVMQEALKCTLQDVPDREMAMLREKLAEMFPDRVATINTQHDYGVLVFLKSVKRRGPTIHIDKFIDQVAGEDKYKPFFLPEHSPSNLLPEESDASDEEYLPTPSALQERIPWQRIMVRRSGHHIMAVPAEGPSSPEPF